jgi:galactonate dehydratase
MAADLTITQIETLRLPEHPNAIWVQIHTADGFVGLGETYYIPGAVESVIHDFAAPLLLGTSAIDRELAWQTLFSYSNFFGYAGAEMRAISAIDIALWDLLGKFLGQPIYALLGGKCRDSIRVYNTCVDTPKYRDQEAFLTRPGALAKDLLAAGYTQMKIWPWDRFAPQIRSEKVTGPAGWSAVGPPGHYLSPADLQTGLRAVQEIREAVGDRMEIAIEGHSRWDVNCAIRIARALEPYNVVWMEDMIQPDSAGDLQRLVRETRVPQCVSERLFTRYAYREILERQAAHIVMLDLIWTGGLTEAVKIASLADTYHLGIAPHDCTGPVNVFAALHLCAAMPNAVVMEVVRGFIDGYYTSIVDRPVTVADGLARFDFGPGLGIALRPELFEKSGTIVRVSER